jgi:iron complex transport system ATP-binding protein
VPAAEPILQLRDVSFRRNDRELLRHIDLAIFPAERWVLLGPNGAGKTSLIRIAGLFEFPTTGTVDLLGCRAGRVDLRELRPRVGFNSPALTDLLRPELSAVDLVTSAIHGSLVPWWTQVTDADRAEALHQLGRVGCAALAEQTYGTLSSGERQRVLLARTLVTRPELLLLDEPGATLDLVGREQLIETLDRLAGEPTSPPMLLVTHHVEQIPASFTHAMLLRDGAIVRCGPIDAVLTAEHLTTCYGLPLQIDRQDGRWAARRAA